MRHLRGPTILYTLENNKAVKMRTSVKSISSLITIMIQGLSQSFLLHTTDTPLHNKQTMILHTKKRSKKHSMKRVGTCREREERVSNSLCLLLLIVNRLCENNNEKKTVPYIMRFIVMESHNGFTPGWIVVCVREYELYQVYQPVKVECFSTFFKFVCLSKNMIYVYYYREK